MTARDPSLPDKRSLRAHGLARRALIPMAEREAAAQALVALGLAYLDAILPSPRIVAGYLALPNELDPAALMAAIAAGRTGLALPRMAGGSLTFHAYEIGDLLEKGAFGVIEPRADAPRVQPDVILAPLLAFDRHGRRLGYGKGFYDRAFASHPEAARCGLAFAAQEVPEVPVEPHDLPLSAVITENGIIPAR
jgi:5-formyltetrahydrofolate cyclo-ligase